MNFFLKLFFGTFFRRAVFFFQNPETWPKTDFSGLFRVAESVRAGHTWVPAEPRPLNWSPKSLPIAKPVLLLIDQSDHLIYLGPGQRLGKV